ncbi:MAG: GNAT family N-acetyltransferase [Desulforhabdus sp.]|jgi:CelD/BcsL family acetyltransferase involved in cellulose biosynthesis|nr:GNAT family N-acetyltransferase [Desulforhabdus sp.]
MRHIQDDFEIEVIDSEARLDDLEPEYLNFQDRCNASIYSSYLFVRTAWRHFHSDRDQLFVLVFRLAHQIAAIAPFKIAVEKIYFAPLRVIRFISQWGEGDGPSIITSIDESLIWTQIEKFLSDTYKIWDLIVLPEQPVESPLHNGTIFNTGTFQKRIGALGQSHYIALGDSWDAYLAARTKKARANWTRGRKKLFALDQPCSFECIVSSEQISTAIERYVALEQRSWKKGMDFSVGGNETQSGFYKDLLTRLSSRGMAALYFITYGTEDIASLITYKFKRTIYAVQITHSDKFQQLSLGLVLFVEVLKELFGSGFSELDFLGFESTANRRHWKIDWASGSRQRVTLNVYNNGWRVYAYALEKMIRSRLSRKPNSIN